MLILAFVQSNMQAQKILKEGDREYLVIALPVMAQFVAEAFVSKAGKSLVYRRTNADKSAISYYISLKLDPSLTKDRELDKQVFRSFNVGVHEFNGLGLPSIKIPIIQKTIT